jgi:D-alanine-D-alanine ligase
MKTRVAVIYGGRSGEHEVSLRSGAAIMQGLEAGGFAVKPYLIDKHGRWQPGPILPEPGANPEIDVVFPIVHGTFGEDGTLQGLLEMADLPYVGPGVMASAVSMDKDMMKRVFASAGVPVVEWLTVNRSELDIVKILDRFNGFPLFTKPARLGSSVGISKVKTADDLPAALASAARYDTKIIVERGVEGREFECSVMGNDRPEASLPCEILPSREFYDYEDKYLLDKAKIEMPAKLSPQETAEVQRLAVMAYRAAECEGLSRVDLLRENRTGRFFVNEINTLPGFTSISMFPKMWEYSGVSFVDLLRRLIDLALDRHRVRSGVQFSR